jgi:hypothetical protein
MFSPVYKLKTPRPIGARGSTFAVPPWLIARKSRQSSLFKYGPSKKDDTLSRDNGALSVKT